ncbi:MAG: hypothetical protein HYS98_08780 [Deltaproteobacteria bacterium]|nr:hypothetical protein [Deltaproteobacteria bacterium]
MSNQSFKIAFKKLINFFQKNKIPYALIGAWANNIWGRPRGTADIDFMILISDENLKPFLQNILRDKDIELDKKWDLHNPMIRHIQSRLLVGDIPIDLMLPRDHHDKETIARARKIKIFDFTLYVASKEDSIIQKVKVGRPRDFEDAASIIKKHKKNLDLKYLREWGETLRISDKLNWLFNQF